MHIPHPTPEQAAALRERAAQTAELFRAFLDQVKELVRPIRSFLRNLAAFLNRDQVPAPDPLGLAIRSAARSQRPVSRRPAWVSPYGPAPRRA